MIQPTLILTPIRQAASSAGGTLEVLLRLQAPDRPASAASTRQPLRLAVVIDRSGSMSGEPLHEALRCAEYIANGLQPSDQVAVRGSNRPRNVASLERRIQSRIGSESAPEKVQTILDRLKTTDAIRVVGDRLVYFPGESATDLVDG